MTWQPPASWVENFDLRQWHTFQLAVKARYALEVHRPRQLLSAVATAREAGLPVLVLGGGSNVLFTGDYPGLVARIAMLGIHPEVKSNGDVLVTAMAGENWHELVTFCLEQGWFGLENLALIPGSVGAAPVQNIGAYGVEVGELIESVTYLDLAQGELNSLSAEQCQFAYRDSIFKHELRNSAVIISCTLRLRTTPEINVSYPALQQAMNASAEAGDGASEGTDGDSCNASITGHASGVSDITPQQVYDTVCAIRRSKLPDPLELGNAGSFFRNPVVSQAQWQSLQSEWPDMPAFPVPAEPGKAADRVSEKAPEEMKVPAAWLIERAGWKGVRRGHIGVHDRQALVLVHDFKSAAMTEKSGQALLTLARDIADSVAEKFDIELEPEVGIQPPGSWSR